MLYCFANIGPQRASAALDCSNSVSGSTQQGAICLPTDPTGVSAKIPDQSANGVILQVINIAAGFAALVAIAFIILGGYRYIFDAGNEEQSEKGKKTVINALIGLVIIILSYTIVVVIIDTANNLGSSNGTAGTATPAQPSVTFTCSDGTVVAHAAECP
jgi:amino acid transporter